MEYAIELQSITKNYRNFSLDGIDLAVPKGCVMGLIGENGAGKTTLIKAALGLIHADEGNVLFHGRAPRELPMEWKEELGVVFDGCSFPEELRLSEIGKVLSKIYRNWDAGKFDRLAEEFRLPREKRIRDFSRGMKMKLSIAVAFSHGAKTLILDEATSGLDPVIRDEILDLFLEFMQDEGHTILISSHITSDLEKIADYITFLKDGKIIFSRSKDDLINSYGILKCRKRDAATFSRDSFVAERENAFDYEVLIRERQSFCRRYPEAMVDAATLEDIILFYVRGKLL